jgi:16S rRNA (cytosine967-C5)-methyltransferase
MDVRLATIKCLLGVVRDQRSLTGAMRDVTPLIDDEHKPVFLQMNFGLLRHYHSLDLILSKLLEKPLPNKHTDLKILLLLGLYQIEYMRTPSHACVNEAVNTTRLLGKNWATGLVNGVLRRYTREKESIGEQLAESTVFQFDHPNWLIKKIQHSWPNQAESILAINNQQAPMTLRVNLKRVSRRDYLEELRSHNIKALPCQISASAITLDSARDVSLLPGFEDGCVSVQDEASQLAVDMLELQHNQSVLDACAAPGGKSCHMLEFMPDIRLVSLELDKQRSNRINDNMARLGLSANTVVGDARQPESWWNGQQYDRILLDAPCSATGIIRRHPDIKLLRRESDIDKLALQQLTLLESLWPLLKRDGMLVYSTCSILSEENDGPIQNFLTQTPDATGLSIKSDWGLKTKHGCQLFPVKHGHDGFYYARLHKSQ